MDQTKTCRTYIFMFVACFGTNLESSIFSCSIYGMVSPNSIWKRISISKPSRTICCVFCQRQFEKWFYLFIFRYFRRLWKVPIGNSGLYEPTEIRLRHLLKQSITENVVYTVFHILAFFGLMGLLINRLVNGAEEVPF